MKQPIFVRQSTIELIFINASELYEWIKHNPLKDIYLVKVIDHETEEILFLEETLQKQPKIIIDRKDKNTLALVSMESDFKLQQLNKWKPFSKMNVYMGAWEDQSGNMQDLKEIN